MPGMEKKYYLTKTYYINILADLFSSSPDRVVLKLQSVYHATCTVHRLVVETYISSFMELMQNDGSEIIRCGGGTLYDHNMYIDSLSTIAVLSFGINNIVKNHESASSNC